MSVNCKLNKIPINNEVLDLNVVDWLFNGWIYEDKGFFMNTLNGQDVFKKHTDEIKNIFNMFNLCKEKLHIFDNNFIYKSILYKKKIDNNN